MFAPSQSFLQSFEFCCLSRGLHCFAREHEPVFPPHEIETEVIYWKYPNVKIENHTVVEILACAAEAEYDVCQPNQNSFNEDCAKKPITILIVLIPRGVLLHEINSSFKTSPTHLTNDSTFLTVFFKSVKVKWETLVFPWVADACCFQYIVTWRQSLRNTVICCFSVKNNQERPTAQFPLLAVRLF